MRLTAKHNWQKGILTWDSDDGCLCISVVFTWNLPEARKYAESLPHRRVRIGGPAVSLMPEFLAGCGAEIGGQYPGVLQKFNPLATRTSVGCIRLCKFCSVPIIEGLPTLMEFGKRQAELQDWPDLPVIADNNLLANSVKHFDRVCDRLEKHPWCDFNQGTDARLVTDHHAERLARLPRGVIRLALDSMSYADAWERAFERLRKAGVPKKNIRSYVLCAWPEAQIPATPDQAWTVCKFVEDHGVKPLPQWFHGLDALEHNVVTDAQQKLGWTDYERRRLMQWFYQHKRAVRDSSI